MLQCALVLQCGAVCCSVMQCTDAWLRKKSDLHNLDDAVGADKKKKLMLLRETHEPERAVDIRKISTSKNDSVFGKLYTSPVSLVAIGSAVLQCAAVCCSMCCSVLCVASLPCHSL